MGFISKQQCFVRFHSHMLSKCNFYIYIYLGFNVFSPLQMILLRTWKSIQNILLTKWQS